MTDNFYAPPHSIEAEQAVIGGLLLDDDSSERVQKVLAMLKPDSFYSRPHKILFEEITRMQDTTDLNRPVAVDRPKLPLSKPVRYTSVSIISPDSYTTELYMLNTWSKPPLRILPMERAVIKMIMGTMEGSVTCSICFQCPAPSMAAAS